MFLMIDWPINIFSRLTGPFRKKKETELNEPPHEVTPHVCFDILHTKYAVAAHSIAAVIRNITSHQLLVIYRLTYHPQMIMLH